MKFFRMSAVSVVFVIFSGNVMAWNAGEIYYSMDASTVNQISPGYNPVLIHDGSAVLPSNGKSFFAAVNIANYSAGSNFVQFSPNIWSAAQWTGLEPVDRSIQSQIGLGYGGNLPSYGNNVFQLDSGKVGMFLNTYGLQRPKPEILSSAMQFSRNFVPSKVVWTPHDNDSRLCVNGLVDLHSWQGSMSQAMVTMGFEELGSNRFFFFNVMMLDTNPFNHMIESVIGDNPADTGAPIAISFFQSQPTASLSRYTSPIPEYGAILEPYQKLSYKSAGNTPAPKNYGFCISSAQFSNVLQDIRAARPQYSSNPSDYRLSLTLFGPEIAGEGTVGMSIYAANVYRITP